MNNELLIIESCDWEEYGEKLMAWDKPGLKVRKGQWQLWQGPNGSGKTTLANAIAGMRLPQNLKLKIKQIGKCTIKMIVQQPKEALIPFLTIEKYVKNSHCTSDFSVDFIKRFGQRHAASLSGGEIQLLMLNILATTQWDLAILDEPMAGLDGQSINQVEDILQDIKATYPQRSLICISHQQINAKNLFDHFLSFPIQLPG